MAIVQALQRQGWYLSTEGISECTDNGRNNIDEIIKVALDLDLKDIGEKHLPDGKTKVDHIDGPFVLQVQKLRNVSAPKYNEESQGAPKMFKLTLSDGHVSCPAIEIDNIDKLNLNTPPGTKVKLLRQVALNQGFLLINSSNCKVLGGRVDKLVENWELKRTLAKQCRSNMGGDGRPPPFIPFGQRRRDEQPPQPQQAQQQQQQQQQHAPQHGKKENFKSLESSKDKKEDTEFEQQRQAVIDKALQAKEGSRPKNFGAQKQISDRDIASLVNMGFSVDQVTRALRETNSNISDAIDLMVYCSDGRKSYNSESRGFNDRNGPPGAGRGRGRDQKDTREVRPERGRGRRGKDDEDMEDMPSKPSAPATLFDFLNKKIPAGSQKESKGVSHKEDKMEETHTEGRRSRNASESDGTGKRGPQNLPPRLLKQQQRREEQRHRNTSGGHGHADHSETSPPTVQEQPQNTQTQQSRSEGHVAPPGGNKQHDSQNQSSPVQRSDDYRGPKPNDYRNHRSEEYGRNQRHEDYGRNQRQQGGGYRNQRPGDYRPQHDNRGQRSDDYGGPRSSNYVGQRGNDYRGQRLDDYRGQRLDDYRGQRSDEYRGSRGRGQHYRGHPADMRSHDTRDRRVPYDSQNRGGMSGQNRSQWSNSEDSRRHNNSDSSQPMSSQQRPSDDQASDTTSRRQTYENSRDYGGRDHNSPQNARNTQKSQNINEPDRSPEKVSETTTNSNSSAYNSHQDPGSGYQDKTYQNKTSQSQSTVNNTLTKSTDKPTQPTSITNTTALSSQSSSLSSSQVSSNGSAYTQQQIVSTNQYEYAATSLPVVIQNQSQITMNGDSAILAMQPSVPPVQNVSMVTPQTVPAAPTYSIPQHVLQQFQGIQITGPPPVQTFVTGGTAPAAPPVGGTQNYVQPSYMSINANTAVSADYARQKYTVAKQVENRGPRIWKMGDYCMAKYYPENKFYRAVVQQAGANNQSYFVNFPDYGNTEEVSAVDIRPVPLNAWEANTIQSPVLPTATMVSQGAMGTMTVPVTMAVPGTAQGMMLQSPTMTYVQAFPRDQPYQAAITNLEYHQAAPAGYAYQSSSAPVLLTSSLPGVKGRHPSLAQ